MLPNSNTDVGRVTVDAVSATVFGNLTLQAQPADQHGFAEVCFVATPYCDFTAPNGDYAITVPIGTYNDGIVFSKSGFATQVDTTPRVLGRDERRRIPPRTLTQTHRAVYGQFYLDGENNHTGIVVTATPIAGTSTVVATVSTAASGGWRIAQLPLSTYSLTVGYPPEPTRETFELAVSLTPGAPLSVAPLPLRNRYLYIAGHAEVTTSAAVEVTVGADDCLAMQVVNGNDFSQATWRACETTLEAWPLEAGDGVKTVCARFTTNAFPSTPTVAVCDDIELDATAAIASVSHDATGPLRLGDTVHFVLDASGEVGGRATIAIAGYPGNILLRDDGSSGDSTASDGVYEVDYTISLVNDVNDAAVTGQFVDDHTNASTLDAQTTITIGVLPRISNVRVTTDNTAQSVMITFDTSEATTAVLSWGEDEQYGTDETSGTPASSHSLTFGAGTLLLGTEYHFRISATDGAGNTAATSDRTFLLRPNVPQWVAAIAGIGRVHVRWEAPNIGAVAGYHVYRSTLSGAGYTRLTTQPYLHEALMYEDSNVTNGATYYYVVTSVDAQGAESEDSAELSATPVAASTGPTNVQGALTGVTTWSEAGSPYMLTGSINVNLGALLAIGPNVDVLVPKRTTTPYWRFVVEGRLAVIGEGSGAGQTGMVRFISNETSPSGCDWDGIDLDLHSSRGKLDLLHGEYHSGHLLHRARVSNACRAVESHGNAVHISESLISDNSAGGIRISEAHSPGQFGSFGHLVVKSSTITRNSAYASRYNEVVAGGIALIENTEALIMNSWITRNSASENSSSSGARSASGIHLNGVYDNTLRQYHVAAVRIYDSHFNNNGGQGAAIDATNGGYIIAMDGCEFLGNSGVRSAIAYGSGYGGLISNTRFANNTTTGQANITGGTLYLLNNTFENNGPGSYAIDVYVAAVVRGNRFIRAPGASVASMREGISVSGNHFEGTLDQGTFLTAANVSYAYRYDNNSFVPDQPVGGVVGGVMVTTYLARTSAAVDARGNYWGPIGTQEILQGPYPRNLSVIWDFYDDIERTEVLYLETPPQNGLPRAIVTTPRSNDIYAAGAPVTMLGSAVDPEDGDLGPTQLEWRDSAGNLLGVGPTITVSNLPIARQSVYLHAYDSTGQTTSHGVTFDVR